LNYRLILLRHGDAATDNATDHDRSLTKWGMVQAQTVSADILGGGWLPEHCLSSTARRAEQTAEWLSDTLPSMTRVTKGALYLASFNKVISVISGSNPTAATLAVVGHNPGLSDLVFKLSGVWVVLGTANAALLQQSVFAWSDLDASQGSWELVQVLRPD